MNSPNMSLDQSRRSGWNQVVKLTAATWSAWSLSDGFVRLQNEFDELADDQADDRHRFFRHGERARC